MWAGSLAARLGKQGWSAWGVYLVTGCLQGVLLGMGIYFEVIDRRRGQHEESSSGAGDESENPNGQVPGLATDESGRQVYGARVPHEQTPLLRDE